MKTILALALFLVIGFAGTRGLFAGIKARLPVTVFFLSGIEFFFLGILLGPSFLDLVSTEALDDLRPLMYLALGWAGLLFGIQLSWRQLRRLSTGTVRILCLDGVTTIGICAVIYFLLLRAFFPSIEAVVLLPHAGVLAITAAISSPTIVAILSRMLPSRGKFTGVAKATTSLSAVIPLFCFGLLFTVANPGLFGSQGLASGVLWWVFANTFGIVMGFVFALLILHKTTRDERLLLVMGTAILVGGICYFLHLSALYTAMIMGVMVGNFSNRSVQIFEQLLSIEKTLYIGFLIIIGAMVSTSGSVLFYMTAAYVVVRLLVKVFFSTWFIKSSFWEFREMGPWVGLSLSAQGGIALAVALDYAIGTHGELAGIVESVIAFGVVANDIIGIFLTRRAFKASGEIVFGKSVAER